MSHLEFLAAYDERLFEQIVRHHRAAAAIATRPDGVGQPSRIDVAQPAAQALRALIAGATVPRTAARESARRELARLEREGAPEMIVNWTHARADPQAAALRELEAGELPGLGVTLDVAARTMMTLFDPFRHLCWLADARRREVLETSELWPFVRTADPDPAIDELLFGTSPLEVDGRFVDAFDLPYDTERRTRWHRVPALPRVRACVQDILRREPPPLEVYRRSYRGLHPHQFSICDDATVPTGPELSWDYARFLAGQQRYVERFARFVGNAARRGWAVVVYIE